VRAIGDSKKEKEIGKRALLVAITTSREKEEIVYRIDCSSNLTNEEFEYYLEEMIKGICKWKPTICERAHAVANWSRLKHVNA
jgi:hypothetical protein